MSYGHLGNQLSFAMVKGSNAGSGTIAAGQATVTGTLAVDTGLSQVYACFATLGQNAVVTTAVQATAALSATAGTIDLKTWKPTSTSDGTIVAGTGNITVNWIAYGKL